MWRLLDGVLQVANSSPFARAEFDKTCEDQQHNLASRHDQDHTFDERQPGESFSQAETLVARQLGENPGDESVQSVANFVCVIGHAENDPWEKIQEFFVSGRAAARICHRTGAERSTQ